MSKIIRGTRTAPTVFVGERQLNFDRQAEATEKLGRIFPLVKVTSDSDGARFIPIEETHKIEAAYTEAIEEAYQRGVKTGQETGLKQGLAKAEEVLRQFDGAIKDAVNQRAAMLSEAKQKVLDLVVQISRKVTFDALEADPDATLKLISGVIDTLLDPSRITIKVNPNHLPVVEQNIEAFLKGSATIKEIKVEGDPRVRYGGCFIETPTGDIDARLESQFEVLEETILSEGHES